MAQWVKNPLQCRRHRRSGFDPLARKIPQKRKWQPTLVFLPEKSHGQGSLTGYSPKGHKELDTTELRSKQASKHVYIFKYSCCFSFAQLCTILCDPMDYSTPVFPVLPWVRSKSCPLSRWCHPTISCSVTPFSFCLQSFPEWGSFQMSQLKWVIRWPKYWSFSFIISPSNEYSGLIFFRLTVWSPCCSRDSQESSPAPQFKSTNSSVLSLLYGATLTSIHDHWKNHSLD